MALTARQREVSEFLAQFIGEHGYAPTIAEIRERFGLRSSATVHQLLSVLEREGVIRRIRHARRAIELVELSEDEDSKLVPLLGVVAAGSPIEAVLSNETVSVPLEMLGRGRTFALRVRGDSMIRDGILEGDILVVESSRTANNGQTVIALVNGSDATVKRFYKERGRVRLQPANEDYRPIVIEEPDYVDIQGVVIGIIRKRPG